MIRAPRLPLALLAAIATTCLTTPRQAAGQYAGGTLFAVRVASGPSSANVGGANVTNGVNVVPYLFGNSTWAAGSALSASPTGASALTISATGVTEGQLSISPDGRYLGLAGYRGGTGASAVDRVVGRVDLAAGSFAAAAPVNTQTAIPNAEGYTSGSGVIRGAVWGGGGDQYWAVGTGGSTTGGLRTNAFGSANGSTQLTNTPTLLRSASVVNGQLYVVSGQTNNQGVYSVGTGTPTAAGQAATSLSPGLGGSPEAFALSPDGKTLYVADDSLASANGGVLKLTRPDTASAFSFVKLFGTGTGSVVGARSLTVDFTTTSPTIYATTAEATGNRLIAFQDVSLVQTNFQVIDTAGAADAFRGVALTPSPVPEPATVVGLAALGLAATGVVRRRVVVG